MARLMNIDVPGDLVPTPQNASLPFLTPGGGISWIDADGFHISNRSAFPGASLLSGQPSGSTVGAVALGMPFMMLAQVQYCSLKPLIVIPYTPLKIPTGTAFFNLPPLSLS